MDVGSEITGRELLVRRDTIGEAEVRGRSWSLADGQVLVEVERVAATANNVTYAVFGEELRYWDAYPAGGPDEGVVPTWGFGRVVGSAAEGIEVGERLYGFWPTATHAVLTPERVGRGGFVDATPHRAALAAAYQRYERSAVDPLHDGTTADLEPLYRPLFVTAFLLDDLVTDPGAVGAEVRTVVVTSASSKTSTALAFLLDRRDDVEVVGVTSAGAVEHVAGAGLVDRVVPYDDVHELTADGPAALVDVAGRAEVREAVHATLGDQLVLSLGVGVTHHDADRAGVPATGPRPTFFFAPARGAERTRDWGQEGLARRVGDAWRPFAAWVADRTTIREVDGLDDFVAEWRALVAGDVDPGEGVLLVPGGA